MAGEKYRLIRRTNEFSDNYELFHRDPALSSKGDDLYAPAASMRVSVKHGHMTDFMAPSNYGPQWHEGHTRIGEEAPLFRSEEQAPRHQVTDLFSDKGHRHMIPMMLGVAQNRSLSATGRGAHPDADLSPHSAHLVSHLQQAGVVGGEPPKVTNDFDFGESWDETGERYEPSSIANLGDSVTPEEMHAGSRTMRSMLRAGRPSRTQHFEQGTLF